MIEHADSQTLIYLYRIVDDAQAQPVRGGSEARGDRSRAAPTASQGTEARKEKQSMLFELLDCFWSIAVLANGSVSHSTQFVLEHMLA